MEPITATTIAVFLAPYLQKAGEKVTEKTIEILFDSRKDLAEKFRGLFENEIITLGLNEPSSEKAIELLSAKPEIIEEVREIVLANQDLLKQVAEALSKQEGRTINTKTYIENAENFTINQ